MPNQHCFLVISWREQVKISMIWWYTN